MAINDFIRKFAALPKEPGMAYAREVCTTEGRDYICGLLRQENIPYEALQNFIHLWRVSFIIYVPEAYASAARQIVNDNTPTITQLELPSENTVIFVILFLFILIAVMFYFK